MGSINQKFLLILLYLFSSERIGVFLKYFFIIDLIKLSAEISADRAGLIGCRNLEAALGAKLVLSSGISSSNFNLVPEKFAKQTSELIDHLIKSESFEDLYSTHPFNPLRVNALYLFHECQELYENFGIGSFSIILFVNLPCDIFEWLGN